MKVHDLGDEAAADDTDAHATPRSTTDGRSLPRRRYGVMTTLVLNSIYSRLDLGSRIEAMATAPPRSEDSRT
jgi:hypothetical protein